MAENNYPRPPWNIWDLAKLRMQGEAWDKSNLKERPNVALHIVNGNPRFRVYMNDGGNNKAISFALDPAKAYSILEAVNHFSRNKDSSRISLELKSSYDHKGGRTDKPSVVSEIFVGRNSDGIVYIAFRAKGEKTAVFNFKSDYFAVLKGADGEALDPVLESELTSRGWAKLLESMIGSYLTARTTEPPKRTPPNGGGGNSGGGGNNFGDDVPF